MARTPSITDEEILDAAREVFFESGLNATTAEIAARAGISEGTIFRRFSTKQELFLAAMGLPSRPTWLDTVDSYIAGDAANAGNGALDDNLTQLAHEVLDFFEELIPKTTMIIASGVAQFPRLDDDIDPPSVRGIKGLANYLHVEQRRGRIRNCDPEVVARMYLGALHMYAFTNTVGVNDYLPMPRHTFVRGVVDNLLRGIAADSAEE